jgi:hypothetical protein
MSDYGRLKIFMWVTLFKRKYQKSINNVTVNDIESSMKKVVIYNNFCPQNQVEDLVTGFMDNNKALRFFDTEYEFIISESKFYKKIPDLQK